MGDFVIATTLGHSGSRWYAKTVRQCIPGALSSHEWATKFRQFKQTGWRMHAAMEYQFQYGAGPLYKKYFGRVRNEVERHSIVSDCRGWFLWSLDSLIQQCPPARAVHLVRNGIQNVGSYHGCFLCGAEQDLNKERFEWFWHSTKGTESPQGWSLFRKICFIWAAHNNAVPAKLRELLPGSTRVVLLEEVSTDLEQLTDFLLWLCPGVELNPAGLTHALVNRPGRHTKWLSDEGREPKGYWRTWDSEQRSDFLQLCGPVMKELGYPLPG